MRFLVSSIFLIMIPFLVKADTSLTGLHCNTKEKFEEMIQRNTDAEYRLERYVEYIMDSDGWHQFFLDYSLSENGATTFYTVQSRFRNDDCEIDIDTLFFASWR